MSTSSREIKIPKRSVIGRFSVFLAGVVFLVSMNGGQLFAGTHDAGHLTGLKASASAPGSVLFIPASAHVAGDNDTNWRTDLEMHNPGQETATVTVSLLRFRESNLNPSQRSYTLDPGESLQLPDILMSVFGLNGAAAI